MTHVAPEESRRYPFIEAPSEHTLGEAVDYTMKK